MGFEPVREYSVSYSKLQILVDQAKTLGLGVNIMSTPSVVWPSGFDRDVPNTWGDMSSSDNWGREAPNQPPELQTGTAFPLEVTEDDEVTFRVLYRDLDEDEPDYVKVVLQNGTDTPFELVLTQDAGSEPWNV